MTSLLHDRLSKHYYCIKRWYWNVGMPTTVQVAEVEADLRSSSKLAMHIMLLAQTARPSQEPVCSRGAASHSSSKIPLSPSTASAEKDRSVACCLRFMRYCDNIRV